MNQLIFNQSKNINITEINISNYQELSSSYNFDELNKRILNYILENKINHIKLSFNNILDDGLSVTKIFEIRELLLFLDITVFSIEVIFEL